jgi:O-antigen/teichoic acid export membrane protein
MNYFILFIGEDFREGVGIVPVILMANLIMGIFFNLSIWYKLTNKTMIGAVLVLVGATITIVINALFIPEYGYVASAWAHLICYSIMVALSFAWSRKYYPIPYKAGRILLYMAMAMGIFILNRLFLQDVGKFRDLWSGILILIFAGILFLSERKTLNSYKH